MYRTMERLLNSQKYKGLFNDIDIMAFVKKDIENLQKSIDK